MALLEVRDLSVDILAKPINLRVVDGLSFSLGEKEILGVVGESGCGKSVTSLALMRLIPPSVGVVDAASSICLEGCELAQLPIQEMRKVCGAKISLILQDSMTVLNPVTTVKKQMIETVRAHRRVTRREALGLSIQILRKMGIPAPEQRINDYPHEFSGGMKQRISIAIALLCAPRVLIADEPTTALDVTIQAQILDLLKRLRDDTGTAIILISHDLGVVADMADNILVMYVGQCVEYSPAVQLFARPLHPYTEGLLASIPRLDYEVKQLPVIPGSVLAADQSLAGCRFAPRCSYASDICFAEPPPLCCVGERRVRCHMYKKSGEAAV
ncbi:MAG: ABC transporter ATP-binding protein [Coriobacteriales bacterium]|jgi:oligopeptide/dipeptide ABC transporter ATP-binding protein|nr:ABC transporter ATP-binding protein [Coriobacteriales bacterium]